MVFAALAFLLSVAAKAARDASARERPSEGRRLSGCGKYDNSHGGNVSHQEVLKAVDEVQCRGAGSIHGQRDPQRQDPPVTRRPLERHGQENEGSTAP